MAIQKSPDQRSSDLVINNGPLIDLCGIKVLLVDDDPEATEFLAVLLGRAHADVVTADSVEDAVHLLRTARPDVIVSDIEMPGCNGYQFMRMVRSRTIGEGGSTPAIALTGHTRAEDQTRAFLAGYQVHLAKPAKVVELLVAISGVVKAARQPG